MACPSEDDRQSLQRTKESFENRWTNVRRTVSTKRRQAEERLLLCKEFWNEYEKFAEWINDTENALKKSEEGMTSGLEISKSRLKRFEVGRKNSYKSYDWRPISFFRVGAGQFLRWTRACARIFLSQTGDLDRGKHLLDFPHGSSCTICPSPISFAWLVTQSRIPY